MFNDLTGCTNERAWPTSNLKRAQVTEGPARAARPHKPDDSEFSTGALLVQADVREQLHERRTDVVVGERDDVTLQAPGMIDGTDLRDAYAAMLVGFEDGTRELLRLAVRVPVRVRVRVVRGAHGLRRWCNSHFRQRRVRSRR